MPTTVNTLVPSPSSNLKQKNFQFYRSDGSTVNNQTPIGIVNQAAYIAPNAVIILRMGIYQVGADTTTSWRYMLQYRKNGGVWTTPETGSATDLTGANTTWTDNAVTASLLDVAPTFVAGIGIAGDHNTAAIAVASGQHTDIVWSVRPGVTYVNGDTIQFRLVAMDAANAWTGGNPLFGYTLNEYVQYPTLYINSILSLGAFNMPERAEVLEVAQLGMETTPGTLVAATVRPMCIEIEPDIVTNIKHHRVAGNKLNTNSSKAKETATWKVTGYAAYDDLLYLFSSILQKVTPTTPTNNGIWTLNAGSGTFTLTYGAQTTTTIAISASAAVVQAALEALSTIGAGSVAVTGTYPNYIVTFKGAQSTGTALTGAGTGLTVTSTAATNARRWTMIITPSAYDTQQTFTLEKGQLGIASYGQQFAYAILTALSGRVNKDEYSISGSGIARPPVDTFTMTTGGVTDLTPRPVDPDDISIFMGSALTGVGAPALLTRLADFEWGISGRNSGFMTVDASQPSWAAHVEAVPQITVGTTIEHDAAGQVVYAAVRANTKQFIVVEAKGENIEGSGNTAYPYRVKITMASKFDQPDRSIVDDVVCMKYNGEAEYDTAFGGAFKVEIDTAKTAL